MKQTENYLLSDTAKTIEEAFINRDLLKKELYQNAVKSTIGLLDKGEIRVVEQVNGEWLVNEWIKKAILLYFVVSPMEKYTVGPYEFFDKIPLKQNIKESGFRVVPTATVRFGSYVAPTSVLMPSFVNIGAYVGKGTMVDTWATVGSCAQIGDDVHLSGGVGIGGVLEPPSARPVIIEDGAFIGSRCILVEGVHVEKEAVLGANVVVTSSTKIIDVTGKDPIEYKGRIPERSVVIPGTIQKSYPSGNYGVQVALIIGKRGESTDRKTSLNAVLRDFSVSL